MTIEIKYKGYKLFEFKDDNAIQILGNNTQLISRIIEVFYKIFTGYKFTDLDIEAMEGYYPEVIKEGKSLKKKDMLVIKISSMSDIIGQLSGNKSSILMKNILNFKEDILVNESLIEFEEKLTELSVIIDRLLNDKLKMGEINIKTDIDNANFETIVKNFIGLNFIRNNNDRVPSWLLDERESIELLVNLIKLQIQTGEKITIIIDRMDIKMGKSNYRIFLESLYELTEENSNFKIWIVPGNSQGVFLDYRIFSNTYIINHGTLKLGDFTTTYESICRNYPDNNLPTEEEVLGGILKFTPYHKQESKQYPSREIIIMSIFKGLLGETEPIKVEQDKLTRLERKFLTIID